ncbi:MAG: 4Fe-4S ferredoxin [Tenericutes bacterium HGW-Tenericutes-6]|nr:MAG: 4Fe-4S ferredoxin [Tenericutes bacterium HGW-Tenericutes-6]
MITMLHKTGIPTEDLVLSRFPEPSILLKPKAVLECYEDIPCNPCATSCPFQAIDIGANINKQPKLNPDLCTGCGLCVPSCPGLAIVIAQLKGEEAYFKIPYEFHPFPEKHDVWDGVNRKGEVICDAKIEHVLVSKSNDHTAIITVSVPKAYLYEFITIRGRHE